MKTCTLCQRTITHSADSTLDLCSVCFLMLHGSGCVCGFTTDNAGAWYLLFNLMLDGEGERTLETQSFLGHGISNDFHGDIEYFYRVHPNEVLVYEAGYNATPDRFTLIQTIGIEAKVRA